ncbi:MAG: alpha/beta fold hydrolase [Verrucomicrobiota bacterium]|nr:alpha/beta fold hydrolase [Verrucomicrobiota bacterium]
MIYFLHGAVGHSSDWDVIIDSLNTFQSHAVNLYSYSSDDIDVAARNINSLANPGDVIVGYSLGARIALQALLEENSPWSKAVIISAHTGITDKKVRNDRAAHDLQWSELCKTDWTRFIADWENQSIFDNSQKIADRNPLKHLKTNISETFIKWSSGIQSPPINNFQNIKTPVLWLTGEFDTKYTKYAAEACDQLSLSKLKIIENSGHRVPWDNPKETADAINVFIS